MASPPPACYKARVLTGQGTPPFQAVDSDPEEDLLGLAGLPNDDPGGSDDDIFERVSRWLFDGIVPNNDPLRDPPRAPPLLNPAQFGGEPGGEPGGEHHDAHQSPSNSNCCQVSTKSSEPSESTKQGPPLEEESSMDSIIGNVGNTRRSESDSVNNSPLRDLMVMGQSGNSLAHYVKEHSRAKSLQKYIDLIDKYLISEELQACVHGAIFCASKKGEGLSKRPEFESLKRVVASENWPPDIALQIMKFTRQLRKLISDKRSQAKGRSRIGKKSVRSRSKDVVKSVFSGNSSDSDDSFSSA